MKRVARPPLHSILSSRHRKACLSPPIPVPALTSLTVLAVKAVCTVSKDPGVMGRAASLRYNWFWAASVMVRWSRLCVSLHRWVIGLSSRKCVLDRWHLGGQLEAAAIWHCLCGPRNVSCRRILSVYHRKRACCALSKYTPCDWLANHLASSGYRLASKIYSWDRRVIIDRKRRCFVTQIRRILVNSPRVFNPAPALVPTVLPLLPPNALAHPSSATSSISKTSDF